MSDQDLVKFLRSSEFLHEDKPEKFNWWAVSTAILFMLAIGVMGVSA